MNSFVGRVKQDSIQNTHSKKNSIIFYPVDSQEDADTNIAVCPFLKEKRRGYYSIFHLVRIFHVFNGRFLEFHNRFV